MIWSHGYDPLGAAWSGLRAALATIAVMLALAFVTRFSGTDVTLGLDPPLVWLQSGPLAWMVPG